MLKIAKNFLQLSSTVYVEHADRAIRWIHPGNKFSIFDFTVEKNYKFWNLLISSKQHAVCKLAENDYRQNKTTHNIYSN